MSEQAMDDVSKFLQDVKEMNARRTEEDDARQRELDEKIQQEKRERQARRAERARSISPQKSSPANTPPPSSQRNTTQLSDDLRLSSPGLEHTGSPRSRGITASEAMDSFSSTSPTKENESPFDTDTKRTSVTSPTGSVQGARPLSWQRRPNSQHSDRSKSRPLSVVAAENAARTSPNPTSDPASATEQTFSKDQIAQALGSKDPSWFRQTADRASVASAASRKSQVEDTDTADMSAMRHQLPGMSRSSSTDLAAEQTSPTKSLGSPLSLTGAQRLDPPAEISSENENPARRASVLSSGSGRMSPNRPVSPTKGMGGFVQSAMMKRSDSVKRWSVTSPAGLARVDSVVSHKTGESRSRPQSMVIRDGASTPTSTGRARSRSRPASRPASRHASRPASRHGAMEDEDDVETTPKASATASAAPEPKPSAEEDDEKMTPPSSPSKTMDSRRWSPTKASWLETALNKPESPKPKPPPTTNQPAWMVELNKAKAQKAASGSVDLGRTGSVSSQKHEVNIGGLMRSSPMGGHNAKPSVSGLKGIFAPPTESSHKPSGSISGGSFRSMKSPTNDAKTEGEAGAGEAPKRSSVSDSPAVAKVKPETPPKKDFRANLKARNASGDAGGSKEQPNELANVFGNLRRTKTQNYVAPDELKGNILRGKAGLNLTGGPKPSERKDEFKDAILKKKEDFKAAQEQGRGIARSKSNAAENPVPEALLKKAEFSKSLSSRPTSDYTIEHRKSVSGRPKSISQGPKDELNEGASSVKSPTGSVKSPTESVTSPGLQKEASAPARLQGRASAGGLANRFNPALAGLLARGPPSMAPNGGKDAEKSQSSGASEPTGPGPQLTHMTKGRARGPKRKAPTKGTTTSSPPPESKPSPAATSPLKEEPPAVVEEPQKSVQKEAPSSIHAQVAAQAALKNRPAPLKNIGKPAEDIEQPAEKPAEKSAEKPTLSPKDADPVPTRRTRSPTMKLQSSPIKLQEEKPVEPVSQPTSPKKLDMKRMSRFLDENNPTSPKPESPQRAESPKRESPRKESPKPDSPKMDGPKLDSPKPESPKRESPKMDSPKLDSPKKESPTKPSPVSTPSIQSKPVFEKPPSPAPQQIEDASPVKTFGRPLPEPVPSSPKKSFSESREEPAPVKTFGRPLPEPRPRSPVRSPIRSPPPNEYSPHVAPLRLSRPSSPQKMMSNDKVDSDPVVSVKNATAMFGGSVSQSPPQVKSPPPMKSPVRSPLSSPPIESKSRFEPAAPPVERTVTPKAAARPLPLPPKPSSPTPVASPMRSPTKEGPDVSTMLDDFFGTPRPQREYRVDTAEALMNKPRVRNIQGQGARLFQITGDGKKIPVPAHNERILFEREMYICASTFTNDAGWKATEVYFWAGDEVPDATVEDAILFVNREARSLRGEVVRMRQGRETPEFILALGGMLITRRGTSTKYDSLAPSMLCGRRILGQTTFVFDEVDFSSASLCSGFPFLIATSGKCYLWKGKGSDVDEQSCARLIGMDLTLTGELIEIDDGSEPDSFWDIFNGGSKPHSADHWRLKPNYDKYCQRLFRSDAASKKQVVEISPFTQTDLDPHGIYVLDAFFEMYIIVGKFAQSQYSSFRIALDFAQEYAILASGMEDRPFIPISTVVLEGIPKDLKSVFRKWRDEASPTIMPQRSGSSSPLKRGRSLRVVPLTQALQALSE